VSVLQITACVSVPPRFSISTRLTNPGKWSGTFLWKKPCPSIPSGKRCMLIGRFWTWGSIHSDTAS
jgi:hypothetical protein